MSYLDEKVQAVLKCDSADRSCWGPRIWDTLDATCELIPCDHCKEHCHAMISFEHDRVRAWQGKPLFNAKNDQIQVESINKQLAPLLPDPKPVKKRSAVSTLGTLETLKFAPLLLA